MSNLSTPEPDPQHKPDDVCIADLVIADHQERKQFGLDKYGDCLKLDDGRNPAIDLYQELLDANVYGRKLVMYVDGLLAKIDHLESEVAFLRARNMPISKDSGTVVVPEVMAHLIKDGYLGGIRAVVEGESAASQMKGATPTGVWIDEVPGDVWGGGRIGEVLKAADVPGGVAGEKVHALPSPYADRPWVEIEGVRVCKHCGEEQLDGTTMRKDSDGMSCAECVSRAVAIRRVSRRGI